MKDIVEYQPIIDELMQSEFVKPLVFRTPRRKTKQHTLADILALRLPDTTPIEAEWTGAAGYHRAPVTGVWESESGAVVLTVGDEKVVPERMDCPCTTTMK